MPTNPDPKFVAKRQGPHPLRDKNQSLVRRFTRYAKRRACTAVHAWQYVRKGQQLGNDPKRRAQLNFKFCTRCGKSKTITNIEAALAKR